jgi:hypothetical protein
MPVNLARLHDRTSCGLQAWFDTPNIQFAVLVTEVDPLDEQSARTKEWSAAMTPTATFAITNLRIPEPPQRPLFGS